jgi:hypothetical protein
MRYNPDVEASLIGNAHPSVWVALSRDPAVIRRLNAGSGEDDLWLPLLDDPAFGGWSDDYATILPFLKGLTD